MFCFSVKSFPQQEFTHFYLRLARSMQACGTQASAALEFGRRGRMQPHCMSLTMNKRELFGASPQVAHRPGFQYVNEVSGSIEPYRAMPLSANSNTLNANGLAASAPRFWVNSCESAIFLVLVKRLFRSKNPNNTSTSVPIHNSRLMTACLGIAEGKKIRARDGFEALWTLIRYRFARRRMLVRRDEADAPGYRAN
jgi:hypothetical protein